MNRRSRMKTSRTRQSGVGLIEILISVVLLSIGFLAAAKMQIEGMRNSQSAYYQSQAYFLAADIIDRMRANQAGVQGGFYNNASIDDELEDIGCDNAGTTCSPAQIALQDLYNWSSHIFPFNRFTEAQEFYFTPALPGAVTGTITPVAGSNGVLQVTLNWVEVINSSEHAQRLSINFVALQQ